MSFKGTIDKRAILDQVLLNTPKISQAHLVSAPQYKAVDEQGNIYLISAPHQWKFEQRRLPLGQNEDGSPRSQVFDYQIKTKSKIHMTYQEAVSEARGTRDPNANLFRAKPKERENYYENGI